MDFASCADMRDVNRVLKTELDLPRYRGESWDELWECMRRTLTEPVFAEVCGMADLWEDYGDELDDMLEVFEQMNEEGGFAFRVTE